MRSIAIRVSVCLSVYLPVCPLIYLNNDMSKHHKFLYMLPMALARSSSNDSAICYVLPVLSVTSCFSITGQIEIQVIGELFTLTRQMASRAKSALADCLVVIATDCIERLVFIEMYVDRDVNC